MDTYKLESVSQFHDFFRVFRSHNGLGRWFRGQADVQWKLLPKAGRNEFYLDEHRDLGRFYVWESKAIAYEALPELWIERLAVAQHHGLATRLLDWTENPLVATYFAVTDQLDKDGVIYILEPLQLFVDSSVITRQHLENNDNVSCYIPRVVGSRLLNQKGMFTVHSPANREIEVTESIAGGGHMNLKRIVIPSDLKQELKSMLEDYGINNAFLFPGLDGLSEDINAQTVDIAVEK